MAGPLEMVTAVPSEVQESLNELREISRQALLRERLSSENADIFNLISYVDALSTVFVHGARVPMSWLALFQAETAEQARSTLEAMAQKARRAVVFTLGFRKILASMGKRANEFVVLSDKDSTLKMYEVDLIDQYNQMSEEFNARLEDVLKGGRVEDSYAFVGTRVNAAMMAGAVLKKRLLKVMLRRYLVDFTRRRFKTKAQGFWWRILNNLDVDWDTAKIRKILQDDRDHILAPLSQIMDEDFADTATPDPCPICIDEVEYSDSMYVRHLVCGHSFHQGYFVDLVRASQTHGCPMCRAPIKVLGL